MTEGVSEKVRTRSVYAATRESLNSHPVPRWYEDAKFGILIHWGLFSVPGFAPKGSIAESFRTDYDRGMLMTPYAEHYWNAIKVPGTPSAEFHRGHYGSQPYRAFKETFFEGLKRWDPAVWAENFRDAGARYVVLVTKHHDGCSLWLSSVANIHEPNWHSERDIVGELASAVRAAGMRFGVYYSVGIDWTFNRRVVRTLGDYAGSTPGGDYPAYATAQVRELIGRYEPSILWNDISWPTGLDELFRLFADYYNVVPEGVVNDRWAHVTLAKRLQRLKPVRVAFDWAVKRLVERDPDAFSGTIPPVIPHSDVRTPEYTRFPDVQEKKWETTRAIGSSFGFNRNESDEDYASFEALLFEFIDAVSKNGNLLLNVGPRGADAQIPQAQSSRLKKFGAWLREKGEAMYGTRPSSRADAVTEEGTPVRFTQKGRTVNLIVLGAPGGDRLKIKGVSIAGKARLLVDRSPVDLSLEGNDLILAFKTPLKGGYAPAICVTSTN